MARVNAWRNDLPAGRVVVFTHFGVVREVLSLLVGFRNVYREIHHASVHRIELGIAEPRAVLWWEPPAIQAVAR